MKDYPLKDIEYFDLVDFINRVERSFNIKLEDNELSTLSTVGEICAHIVNKIELEDTHDCTSQQAFYKLRESVSKVLQIDKRSIAPQTLLTDILPKSNRRSMVKQIEANLGFDIYVLRAPYWVSVILAATFVASLIILFFNWKIGVVGVIISIIWFKMNLLVANVLDMKTVGEVAQRMTIENYIKSRRNPNTFNKKELEGILMNLVKEEVLYQKC